MYRLLIVLFVLLFTTTGYSQPSDLLSVRKKNGRIIKTFTAGSPIVFKTAGGFITEGRIAMIRNDSVYLRLYDVRQYPTAWGTKIFDTVAMYLVPSHYKDIQSIEVFTYKRFIRGKIDKLLIVGGAGYFVLNVLNGGYLNEKITERVNLQKLGISLGAFGIGLLIKKYFYVNRFSRKKHRIVYIKMN